MPSLVLEGGTFRPIYSCGVMDALLDNGLQFDYVIGVSAGISYAYSYVSGQRGRNLEVLTRFRHDKRYLGARNFLTERSIFGLDFAFDEIPNHLIPFDGQAFLRYPGRVRVGVTSADTGKPVYFDGKRPDPTNMLLRATCAIPHYFPAIMLDGKPYYDGGVSDPIPILKSLRDGNDKHLIVLTQPDTYRKRLSRGGILAAHALRRRFPAMERAMLTRPKRYNETVCFCRQLAKKRPQSTVLLQPEAPLHSFEKDLERLWWGYQMGYDHALARMDDIRALF